MPVKPQPYREPEGIAFPNWVQVTPCEHVSRSRSFASPHGRVKFVTYEWTDRGRFMTGFRAAELARAERVVPIHRTVHRGRVLAS
jgi:hypothetical protein